MIEQVSSHMEANKVTIKKLTEDLTGYLGVEWDDKFYQHIRRVIKGEVEISTEEEQALAAWLYAEQNPHVCGAHYAKLEETKSAVSVLKRYMRSGIYDGAVVNRLFIKIQRLLG
jgi:hypothetical protein